MVLTGFHASLSLKVQVIKFQRCDPGINLNYDHGTYHY